jgi:HEAT repeat protein
MKRFILPLILVGIMAVTAGGIGFVVIKYALDLTALSSQSRPYSYEEMEKMLNDNKVAEGDLPRLLAGLDRNDEDTRLMSALALASLGPKAVDPLREKLKSRNAKVRFGAAQAFAHMAPQDAMAASADLAACVDDNEAEVRRKAIYVLGRIGGKGKNGFAAIVKGLKDSDPEVAKEAMSALEKMDSLPKEALPELVKLAKDSKFETRSEAFKLLGKMGEPAVPAFKDLLKTADPIDRGTLIKAAAPFGAAAKPLLPELQSYMETALWWDNEKDLFAVFKACGPEGAAALASVLKSLYDPKSPHFNAADDRARVLLPVIGQFGSQAKDTTPMLVTLLKDRESLQPMILETLGDIGPSAKDAVPAVQALTTDPRVGPAARAALKRMGVSVEK